MKIRGNYLLYQIIATYAAFWGVAVFADKTWLVSLVTTIAGISGVALAVRYVPKSLAIIFKGDRGVFGAHNAVLGTAEVAVGMCWIATYRTVWYAYASPVEWIGSGAASFGLFLMAKGFLRVAISPSTIGEDYKLPENLLSTGVLAIVLIFGVVIGKVMP